MNQIWNSSMACYMPRTQDYYDGFKDGYNVAKQEIKDFQERMGDGINSFTGTACVKDK